MSAAGINRGSFDGLSVRYFTKQNDIVGKYDMI